MIDDRWRDSYDSWKLRSPYDDDGRAEEDDAPEEYYPENRDTPTFDELCDLWDEMMGNNRISMVNQMDDIVWEFCTNESARIERFAKKHALDPRARELAEIARRIGEMAKAEAQAG